MDKIDELLEYIRRTNPEITREKLIEELLRCDYATQCILISKNSVKQNDTPPICSGEM